ncbi:MAG: glyoxalase/bleomycin resistance/dioxygenase family protein [Proteobacteria bacterium]|nr:glyoxalase/bleomycin resistance/dioxygenase family protein [Pseudomonadota bacterium]
MKRLHVHVVVQNLGESVRFYSTLFAAEPTVIKDDYAKWMLEDPRVNFAISNRGGRPGVDHLGIQVEDDGALSRLDARLRDAGRTVHEQKAARCCYARGDKVWVTDPQGVAWETFATFGEINVFGEDSAPA